MRAMETAVVAERAQGLGTAPTARTELLKCDQEPRQSRATLCGPVDHTVHGVLRARILEWAAVPFSRGSSRPRGRTQVSRIAGGFFTS